MVNDSGARVIGIDMSGAFGSGIRGGLVDGAAALIAKKEAFTPRTGAEDLISSVATMASRLAELSRREGPPPTAVGVAVPGLVDEFDRGRASQPQSQPQGGEARSHPGGAPGAARLPDP